MTKLLSFMQINDELPQSVGMHAPLQGAKANPRPLGVVF